jgi:hypothetical protein
MTEPNNHLVKAAKEIGAVEVVKPAGWDNTKSINEVIGDQHIHFYPDLPKFEWPKLVDNVFRILAIKIVDWDNSRFGKTSFPLFLIDFEDDSKGTTLGSGVAILNQAKALLNKKGLPVKARLIMKPPEQPAGQPYYFLEGTK